MMRSFLGLFLLVLASSAFGQVVIELTYPVGRSPKVFTEGWLFGAKATVNGKDASAKVQWSGTGSFSPSVGNLSQPRFRAAGSNQITLSIEVGGKVASRRFQIQAVKPDGFAAVGDVAFCPSDVHPDAMGSYVVSGPVLTGSKTVSVRGKPAARKGDTGVHATCSGDNTFEIIAGDTNVLIDGLPAARFGDRTRHCGGMGQLVKDRPAQQVMPFEGTMSPPLFQGPVKWGILVGGGKSSIFGTQTSSSPKDKSVRFKVSWTGEVDMKTGAVSGQALIVRTASKSSVSLSGRITGKMDLKAGSIRAVMTIPFEGEELKCDLVLKRY